MASITTIQLRRGTAAQWTAANPVLAAGEFGWESNTGNFKIGDGVTAWNTSAYWISEVGAHEHPAAHISDATAFGRNLIKAADAAGVRTLIGAGTSNLAIGTTSSTAMRGDRTFNFAEIQGTLGTAQLPPLAINEVFVVATQAAMIALTAQRGDMAIRTDSGETFVLASDNPATLVDWKKITSPSEVTSVAGRQGAVVLAKSDVGLGNVDNTSDANKPVSTAAQTALNAKENTIPTGTTSQFYRGDKTWQALTKALVGLANVDNTSDANKPVSTATLAALNGKEDAVAAGTTSQFYRGDKTWQALTKSDVGLGNVDNTTDANKPISTATQTALNGKASSSHTHTKSDIGLGNVDNTTDANKPVSTATQTALNGKAASSHTHSSSDILGVDGGTP